MFDSEYWEDNDDESMDIIEYVKEGVIPQMIIITNHRELEELADTLYEVKKQNKVSK